MLINADDGRFKEASWVTNPVKYLLVSREDAQEIFLEHLNDSGTALFNLNKAIFELVHRDPSPYYPNWKITFNDKVFFVSQDGRIDS